MEERQTKLFEKMGVIFAFSNKQFNEQKVEGTKYVNLGVGQLCPKKNVDKYISEMDKIVTESIAQDLRENGKKNVIHRELGNHEYCITYDVTDTVDKLIDYGITEEEIRAETREYLKAYYKWEAEQEKVCETGM